MFTPSYLLESLTDVLFFIESEEMERASLILADISEFREQAAKQKKEFGATATELQELRMLEKSINDALTKTRGTLMQQMNTQKKATGAVGAYQRLSQFN
tara:strand:+ start:292 stop:591 length:300 start_codon:yes stop_codon:yes gene_type:complete